MPRNAQEQATSPGIPRASAEVEAAMPKDEEHICEDEMLPAEWQPEHEEPETHFPMTLADQGCETALDMDPMKERKWNIHRLNKKVRRLNESLGSLEQQLDEVHTQLQNFEKDSTAQALNALVKAVFGSNDQCMMNPL